MSTEPETPEDSRRLPDAECNYHSLIGGPVTTSGHRIRKIGMLNGQIVAWITGKAGCVAIEALSK